MGKAVYKCILVMALGFAALLMVPERLFAVRPFVTDDARVVGEHQMQLETSVRYDKDVFSNLNLVAFGPTRDSEVTIGGVNGFDLTKESNRTFSLSGPLMQFKYLVMEARPNGRPGLAFAVGASPPWGKGDFRTTQWSEFIYAAMTESLLDNERILIHVNLGLSTTNPASVATWGIGTQIRLVGGLHGVAEVFYNDPYAGRTGGACQLGFRHIISDAVQVDFTGGTGLFGSVQINTFLGMGLRIVSDKLF